jgi:hypothetical protein
MDPVRHTLLPRATAGQCGRDIDHSSLHTIRAVTTLECPAALAHADTSEAMLCCASTLHRYELPHDYARLESLTFPEVCPCCSEPLWDLGQHATRAERILVWQSHLGRCGVDGRRHQAHEAVKLAMKRLVLTNHVPEGCVFPRASVMIELPHLRQDKYHPGVIYAMGTELHRKNSVMDIVVTSALHRSC